MRKAYQLTDNAKVNAMLAFEYPAGDMIPHAWFDKITTERTVTLEGAALGPDGKQVAETYRSPYWLALHLLSKIVYWYIPSQEVYPDNPNVVVCAKRFGKGRPQDYLKASYKDLARWTHESYDANKRAIIYLENEGLIRRVFRNTSDGDKGIKKEMYIDIFPERILAITYPDKALPKPSTNLQPERSGKREEPSPKGIGDPRASEAGRSQISSPTNAEESQQDLPKGFLDTLFEGAKYVENSGNDAIIYGDNVSTTCEDSMKSQVGSCVGISTDEAVFEQAPDLRKLDSAADNLMRGNFHDTLRITINKNTPLCEPDVPKEGSEGSLSESQLTASSGQSHQCGAVKGTVPVDEALASWPQDAIDAVRAAFGDAVDADFLPTIKKTLAGRGYAHA